MTHSGVRTVLLLVAGLVMAASALALRAVFPPFALAGTYLFGVLLFASRRISRGRWVLYNVAPLFLALAIGEIVLFYAVIGGERKDKRSHYTGSYTQRHSTDLPELGYGSIRERRTTTVQKFVGGTLVYDVSYATDENGLRTTENHAAREKHHRAQFFGCSFTFGEGVADTETLPSSFHDVTGLAVVNFGFHGYGPHQMLRALETGLPRKFGYGEPAMVVYTLLPTHIDRSAGRSPWDRNGPRYRIVDGQLRYEGPFSKSLPPVEKVLAYSQIFTLVQNLLAFVEREDLDRRTLLAIVADADRLVRRQYGVPLTVMLWDMWPNIRPLDRDRAEWLRREAQRRGLRLMQLSEHAPQLNDPRYYIPGDGHPNGAGYVEAAQALAHWDRNNR